MSWTQGFGHAFTQKNRYVQQFKTEHEDLLCKHSIMLFEVPCDHERYSQLSPLSRTVHYLGQTQLSS